MPRRGAGFALRGTYGGFLRADGGNEFSNTLQATLLTGLLLTTIAF